MAGLVATSSSVALKPFPATAMLRRSAFPSSSFTSVGAVSPPPSISLRSSFGGRSGGMRRRLTAILLPAAAAAGEAWGHEGGEEAAVAAVAAEELYPAGEMKRNLMDLLRGTDRGLKASSERRGEIVELIAQLESRNPTPAPTEALSLLHGKWILAYTSSTGIFPVLSAVGGSLPAALVRVEEMSQSIDAEGFTVQNSVRFAGPISTTSVSTNANFDIRSPIRVQMKFVEGVIGTPQLTDSISIPEKVEFLGQSLDLSAFRGVFASIESAASSIARSISGRPPLKIPINGGNHAESWLLTTYLDGELRISRGDGGSVFVLTKEGSSLSV